VNRGVLADEPDNLHTYEYVGEGYVAAGHIDLAELQLAIFETFCGMTHGGKTLRLHPAPSDRLNRSGRIGQAPRLLVGQVLYPADALRPERLAASANDKRD
jgi:hypothetical protein